MPATSLPHSRRSAPLSHRLRLLLETLPLSFCEYQCCGQDQTARIAACLSGFRIRRRPPWSEYCSYSRRWGQPMTLGDGGEQLHPPLRPARGVDFSRELPDGTVLRPVQEPDAPALAAAFQANRAYLAPWEPARPEDFYTVAGQQEVIARRRTELEAGTSLPMVLAGKGGILGLLTFSSIVRGAFQNAHVGYWTAQRAQEQAS